MQLDDVLRVASERVPLQIDRVESLGPGFELIVEGQIVVWASGTRMVSRAMSFCVNSGASAVAFFGDPRFPREDPSPTITHHYHLITKHTRTVQPQLLQSWERRKRGERGNAIVGQVKSAESSQRVQTADVRDAVVGELLDEKQEDEVRGR